MISWCNNQILIIRTCQTINLYLAQFIKPDNYHVFITTGACNFVKYKPSFLGWFIFTEITYTQLFIFQNKLIFIREITLVTCYFN